MNLGFTTALHGNVMKWVAKFVQESRQRLSKEFPIWKDADTLMRTYMPTANVDLLQQYQTKKRENKLHEVDVIYPYSYAVLEAATAHVMSLMFSSPPLYAVNSSEIGRTVQAKYLEKILQNQVVQGEMYLPMVAAVRDAFKYSIGALVVNWQKRVNKRGKILYEGNRLKSVDPYLLVLDFDGAGSNDSDVGSFFGYFERVKYTDLIKQSKHTDYINLKHLRSERTKGWNSSMSIYDRRSQQTYFAAAREYDDLQELFINASNYKSTATKSVWMLHLMVDFIPKDEGFGSSSDVERWYFKIVNNVIIGAEQKNTYERMPAFLLSPVNDGHSLVGQSFLSNISGLQFTINSLIQTHIKNRFQAVDHVLIYNPWIINRKAMEDKNGPRIIPTTRNIHGQSIANSIYQLPIRDVTAGAVNEAMLMKHIAEDVTGFGPMMGTVRQTGPDRLTGVEARTQQMGSQVRLDLLFQTMATQGFQPLGEMMIENIIELSSRHIVLQDHIAESELIVDPKLLDIAYTLQVRVQGMPKMFQEDLFKEIFGIIVKTPTLSQRFDITEIFSHMLKTAGMNDEEIGRFIIKVTPDEEVQQSIASNEIAPIEEVANA